MTTLLNCKIKIVNYGTTLDIRAKNDKVNFVASSLTDDINVLLTLKFIILQQWVGTLERERGGGSKKLSESKSKQNIKGEERKRRILKGRSGRKKIEK